MFIAVNHGRTMERLVAANSWPNISYATGNENNDLTRQEITLSIMNTSVGPVRIDSFELFYKGQALPSAYALMKACCNSGAPNLSTSTVRDEVLPARDTIDFLTLPKEEDSAPVWDALNRERMSVRIRVCYCSVFDECWVRDTNERRPTRTDQCTPSQPIQYR